MPLAVDLVMARLILLSLMRFWGISTVTFSASSSKNLMALTP